MEKSRVRGDGLRMIQHSAVNDALSEASIERTMAHRYDGMLIIRELLDASCRLDISVL
ncbi:MAG: hypothetical protein ACKVIZ_02865 [Pseudomonadales bacterium]